jgi:hypothetical protein
MTYGRENVDPKNEYPSECLRLVESNALRILKWRPDGRVERTRDVIQISYNDERGIVVLVTAEVFEVRLPTIEWTCGSYGPVDSSRFWRRIKVGDVSDDELNLILSKALKARQSQFKRCRYCGNSFPPEHRDSDVCHGCAENILGIVH